LTTLRQQKFLKKIMTQFYKLTTDTAAELLAAKLPRSSWELWTWATTLDPFGDRRVRITWEIAKKAIGISRTTFYRALAQLTDAGLLISERVFGFWISPKNGNPVPEIEIGSQKCVSESQKWDSTIYTDLQTFSYSPDRKSEEKEKIPDPEINTNGRSSGIKPKIPEKPATAEVNQNSSAKPVGQGEEKYSAAHRTKKRTSKNQGFDWLPQGPWNIEGKLDPNFRDWLAKNWLKRYGGDFHDKQADVLAHFKKDPANLPIRWEQYQKEFVHRVENTQMRLANGCQIPEDQQRNLITHQRAVTAVLPPEMNPVAVVEPTIAPVLMPGVEEITRGLEVVEPVADLSPSKNSQTESSPPENSSPTPDSEYTILPDGTRLKVFQRQQKSEPVAPEQAKVFKEMVQGLLKGFGGKREVCPKPQSELERLNQWLYDPILREEAILYVRRSPSYKYCPDTDQIIHCEEF
jgi:hypothetical protein